MSYINNFLSLNCAGDVLNVIPKHNYNHKEITESWAMIRQIKPITLDKKLHYDIIDLCAGNAITSVLSAFILPVRYSYAIDKQKRSGKYENVKKFSYREIDIYNDGLMLNLHSLSQNAILISVHPCKTLAERIIEIYNNSKAPYLFLMPCCIDPGKLDPFIASEIDKYTAWCFYLLELIKDSHVKMVRDRQILSPCNIIIMAERKG